MALVTESDLEQLAEEQVLEEEALAAAQGADERREEEPEQFDHRGRMADRRRLAGQGADFCPLHPTHDQAGGTELQAAAGPGAAR